MIKLAPLLQSLKDLIKNWKRFKATLALQPLNYRKAPYPYSLITEPHCYVELLELWSCHRLRSVAWIKSRPNSYLLDILLLCTLYGCEQCAGTKFLTLKYESGSQLMQNTITMTITSLFFISKTGLRFSSLISK